MEGGAFYSREKHGQGDWNLDKPLLSCLLSNPSCQSPTRKREQAGRIFFWEDFGKGAVGRCESKVRLPTRAMAPGKQDLPGFQGFGTRSDLNGQEIGQKWVVD